MHGAVNTQELDLNAIQFWGCTAENKELSGFCFQQVAPGPAVFGGNLDTATCKQRSNEPKPTILFCSGGEKNP